MRYSRRSFLATTALASTGLSLPVAAAESKVKKRIKLGISSYSYWHFKTAKVPIETVIDKAAQIGVEGVDILHRQMDVAEKAPFDAATRAYCQKLKRHAFVNGIDLICFSIHQNFVQANPEERQRQVEHTLKCIEIAYQMGVPCIRLNSGRWNTIASFDDLMKARGEEPILPGHTEDEGFKWCIDSIEKCLPKAAECGVVLALENHWGLTRTPEGHLRILDAIQSPWLGALLDTGNYLENPYTLDLDYKRIAGILAKANYTGYVSLEMEGKEDPDKAVPKSVAMLRKAFGA
jgi:L-ribulose-5-phosphate 3-epimerase